MTNPANDIDATRAKLRELESHLRQRIRGQDQVIARIASLLQRGELGLRNALRGSALLLSRSAHRIAAGAATPAVRAGAFFSSVRQASGKRK